MVDQNELHFLCYSYCCILAFLNSSEQSEQGTWLCALFLSKKCLQTCINYYNSRIVQPSFKFSLWISQRYWQASKTLSVSWTSSPFLETDSLSSDVMILSFYSLLMRRMSFLVWPLMAHFYRGFEAPTSFLLPGEAGHTALCHRIRPL